MKRLLLLSILLLGATRAARAVTCGGFSIVPADHVLVKYSAALPGGATHSAPVFSMTGSDFAVTRNVSGGSTVDSTCVEDTIDLGVLPAGRYNVSWIDTSAFSTQHASFSFVVAGTYSGSVLKTTLVPPALPDKPVRLELVGRSLTPAVAYFSGDHRISVIQYDVGPPVWQLYVLDLGILPAGRYDVVTQRMPASTSTDAFGFIVQQPPSSSTCGRGFSIGRTASGTTRLRYEDSYVGYAPSFGPPTASEIISFDDLEYAITVTQPVADIADRRLAGSAPTQTFCHAEELDLGVLPDAAYDLTWADLVNVAGGDAGAQQLPPTSFRLQDGAMQCMWSTSFLQVPAAVGSGQQFEIARTKLDENVVPVGLNVAVHQNVITVSETLFHEGPIALGPPGCYRVTATVPALAPGQYTVNWLVSNYLLPQVTSPAEALSTSITVTPARQRAARH